MNEKTNKTKTNKVFTIDSIKSLDDFVNHINEKNANGELIFGVKNNVQFALSKCGIMVNANSFKYVPNDAYCRFNNNAQFQLQFSNDKKCGHKFVGFNIRLCSTVHKQLFENDGFVFTDCNDNHRIYKSDFVSLDKFVDTVKKLVELEKYSRDKVVVG